MINDNHYSSSVNYLNDIRKNGLIEQNYKY